MVSIIDKAYFDGKRIFDDYNVVLTFYLTRSLSLSTARPVTHICSMLIEL
jgi:hypothetical protein